VVVAVTRRSLARPIKELLGGAAALGRGDLAYRVIVPRGGGELASLAREFNRMADSLAEQRRAAAREAEERLALERSAPAPRSARYPGAHHRRVASQARAG
jgi:nitrogen fixation/metabolism regulation signal transduction histidine kinase